MKKFLAALTAFIAVHLQAQSCYPGRFSETPLFDSVDIHIDSNIVFATSRDYFSGAMQNLMMDVYYPDASVDTMQNRPFLLLIHGGAFLAGNRHDMNSMCIEYARRGFVVATMQYRLGWNCAANDFFQVCFYCQGQSSALQTATYEAAQDARAALRYVHANCTGWNADPNNLFIGGNSAGSITAYHAAFWDQAEANAFNPSAVAQVGLLDTAGNSLPSTWTIRGVIDHCGAISRDSSLLNNGDIPVISFHDEFDCIVPYGYGQVISCYCSAFWYSAGSQVTHNFLSNAGVCSELNTVPGSNSHCTYPTDILIKRSSCFIKNILCNNCVTRTNTNVAAVDSCNNLSSGIAVFGIAPIAVTAIPNPSAEWCSFRFSEPTRNSGSVRIYNAYGELVLVQQYVPLTSEVRIHTAAFSDGIYFAETDIQGQKAGVNFSVAH